MAARASKNKGHSGAATHKILIPFIIYPTFVIPFLFLNIPEKQIIAASLSIGGFILTAVLSLKYERQLGKKEATHRTRSIMRTTFVFALLYSLVAALGITKALENFSTVTLSHIFSNFGVADIDNLAILVSFFAVAILFFHGGITFLATEAAQHVTANRLGFVFLNFILLFMEGMIIFFMADNINSGVAFVSLIAALMIIDIAWILINKARKEVVFIEWIHFNSLTILFIITIQIYGIQTFLTNFLIAGVLIARTVADYIALWDRFYSKYPLTEM